MHVRVEEQRGFNGREGLKAARVRANEGLRLYEGLRASEGLTAARV